MTPVQQTIVERIRQRRSQMLIHSYLYYRLDEAIVSDHKWQEWADELVRLQAEHPHPIGFYDVEFADWNASTGYHLPHDAWVREKAERILAHHNKQTEVTDLL